MNLRLVCVHFQLRRCGRTKVTAPKVVPVLQQRHGHHLPVRVERVRPGEPRACPARPPLQLMAVSPADCRGRQEEPRGRIAGAVRHDRQQQVVHQRAAHSLSEQDGPVDG